MDDGRKSLIIAVAIGSVLSIIACAFVINNIWQSKEDEPFAMFFILIIVIGFFGTIFWIYHQIEYDRKMYKGEKRPWWSWFWNPKSKRTDGILWNGIIRVTFGVPFIIYFILFFIVGYSIGISFVFAILFFLLILFTCHELLHYSERKKEPMDENVPKEKIRTWLVIPFLLIIIFILIALLPSIEQPKGNYMVYSAEEKYIGTWSNSEITMTFNADHTISATYNNTVYNGWWHYQMFGNQITWSTPLQLPHPYSPSTLYTVTEAYVVNHGNSISLYNQFQYPPELTLNKVA